MANITKKITINAPFDRVFDFARDPNRWHQWYVGLHAPDKIVGSGDQGTIVNHKYTLLGISFPVTTKVTESVKKPAEALWRATMEGPLAGRAEWFSKPVGNNTELTVKHEYTVPLGELGKIADRLLIERMNERALEHTLENLKLFCEAAVPVAV
jgi:uncharacterized membrane protein